MRRWVGPAACYKTDSCHSTPTCLGGQCRRGSVEIDANPNDVGTELLLPVLSVGDEAGGVDGVSSLHIAPHHVPNLGTDSAPFTVQWSAVESTK